MNNDDERDFEEEQYNRDLGHEEPTEDEVLADIDDGPRHWLGATAGLQHGEIDWEKDLTEALDEPKLETFLFTFGVGHKLVVYLPEMHDHVEPQEGFSLAGYFVKIEATDELAARLKMIKRWGHQWSSCYSQGAHSMSYQNVLDKYKELKFS